MLQQLTTTKGVASVFIQRSLSCFINGVSTPADNLTLRKSNFSKRFYQLTRTCPCNHLVMLMLDKKRIVPYEKGT